MPKFVSIEEAVKLIPDGATLQIGVGGIGMCRKVGHDEAVGRAVALYDI